MTQRRQDGGVSRRGPRRTRNVLGAARRPAARLRRRLVLAKPRGRGSDLLPRVLVRPILPSTTS